MQNPAKGRPKPLGELKTPSLLWTHFLLTLSHPVSEMRLYQQLLPQRRAVHSELPLMHICHFRLRCCRDVKTAGK